MAHDPLNQSSESPESVRLRPRVTMFHALLVLLGIGLGITLCFKNPEYLVPKYIEKGPGKSAVQCTENLLQIAAALDTYKRDHSTLPTSQYDLIPKYLEEPPVCPAAGRATYRTAFKEKTDSEPEQYLIECCGDNHTDLHVAPDYPAYNNKSGLLVKSR